LADFDRLHDGEFVGIYHADGVALLVRDIGGEGARLAADHDEDAHAKQPTACPGEAGTSPAQKTRDAPRFRHWLFEPALTFGTVDPERIQFGNLMQKCFLWRDRNDHSAVAQKNGLTKLKIQSRSVNRRPLNAAKAETGPLRKSSMTFESAERVLDAPSPIIRTAVHACMSRAVIRRENCLMNRSCSWTAPHWSCAPSQLVGTRPADPATGLGSQVRYGK